MMSRIALAAFAFMLTAESPPPPSLTPYVKAGRFDPGDYGWMRGAFADAVPAQKVEWSDLLAWRERCLTEQVAAASIELTRRGVAALSIEHSNGSGLCGAIGYALPHGDQGDSWTAFRAALAQARPVAQAIVWSAALAQAVAEPDKPDTASLLIARPMTDQLLRSAISWNGGETKGAPPLDPPARRIAERMIWLAIAERDHANTAWLEATVAAQGWPTIAKVGKDASHMAWLLVQHADDDPVFQLDTLRPMEPLANRSEVAKKDYAYLYDRVMLKLAGKQRYASQMTCAGGRYAPLPLEDAAAVDTLRRQMDMDTLARNIARMEKAYGLCPADVTPVKPATH